MQNETLDSVHSTQDLAPILDADVTITADAAENSETLINRNVTEIALQEDVQDYIDGTLGYAEQYSDWAITTVSYLICIKKQKTNVNLCDLLRLHSFKPNLYFTWLSTLIDILLVTISKCFNLCLLIDCPSSKHINPGVNGEL